METIIKVYPNQYYDSVQLLYITSAIRKQEGVKTAFIAMGTEANKEVFLDIGIDGDAIHQAGVNDMVIGVKVEDAIDGNQVVEEVLAMLTSNDQAASENTTYSTIDSAVKAKPKANFCIISVPADYAKAEAMKALNAGLHVLIFSDNVPLEDEREIKLLAEEKGLLCMGPDCGVANINGISFMTGSIVRKGPIGICAASGAGLQQVSALIHLAGSGMSQGIGTGGKDLRDKVGGITMLSGIDALERDEETKIIVLISRKPEKNTLEKILKRISVCKKPTVVCFMGCEKDMIEESGALYASDLEDTARKALSLQGIILEEADTNNIKAIAEMEAAEMAKEQKYVRGLFCGGTFCEEAMVVMSKTIGDIYSNAPLTPNLKLPVSSVSVANSVVDYGDEEFTKGRPHPDFDPEPRGLGILREAKDPETAVILLDFIIGPGVHCNPVGAIIADIREAMNIVKQRNGKLSVVATVCGTEDDPQKRSSQEAMLRDAGVYVCPSNYQAALLVGEIIKSKGGIIGD